MEGDQEAVIQDGDESEEERTSFLDLPDAEDVIESEASQEEEPDIIDKLSHAIAQEGEGKKHPKDSHYEIDERRKKIYDKIKITLRNAPKTLLQKAEEQKSAIERQLEESEKVLEELTRYGDELISNIKIANEKRELLRRELERSKKTDLQNVLKNEAIKAFAKFNDIAAKWSELETLKEPILLFEQLEVQKTRIAELMQSKDDIILQCQEELNRINEKFDTDQAKQSTEICCLIERIDTQIEFVKDAYRTHMELLEKTIKEERERIALESNKKWETFYKIMEDNEEKRLSITREKEKFYATEIAKIMTRQEEITRATRIRLEKDAEILEWDLRNARNNVLMNTEKVDYNYQVLKRRNEENIIINNQQKRRLAKLTEGVSNLKKKINATASHTDNTMHKLREDIQKLHATITELERKSVQFKAANRKKFQRVWDVNFREVVTKLNKVFEIDRILHEQQLVLPWERPNVDMRNINLTIQKSSDSFDLSDPNSRNSKKGDAKECKDEERIKHKLLQSILRQIADRGGFLIEEKLLKILEPFTEEEQCIVRIDSIFNALRINDLDTVSSLTKYFEPYAWCPNCSTGIPAESLNELYKIETELKVEPETAAETQQRLPENTVPPPSKLCAPNSCENHYLVIEPTFVLTCLSEFTRHHLQKHADEKHGLNDDEVDLVKLDDKTIKDFWSKFATYIPEEKKKLWAALEHGLNHFLDVLKKREQLDTECTQLRQQNEELKHLLQKFNI